MTLHIETCSSFTIFLAGECNTFAMDGILANNVENLGVLFAAGPECSSTSRYIVEQIFYLGDVSLVNISISVRPLTVI